MPLPILMYHEVEDGKSSEKRYTVATTDFERQLRHLQESRYATILLDEHFHGRTVPGTNRVAITFDDSHLCHYAKSFPLLAEHGLRATFFVVTDFIGQDKRWLTREHILAMRRGGMSIQSHTHTHRFLDTLSESGIREELGTSKALLEDWLGEEITILSCPGGRYNPAVLEMAATLGYKAVCTSVPGLASTVSRHDAVPMLPRFLMTGNTSFADFERMIRADKNYVRRKRLGYWAKYLAKRSLGNNMYHHLWQYLAKKN